MSDLYEEENDDDELLDPEDEFVDLDKETINVEPEPSNLDARRRLESLLEEKRLRDELDDFLDY